MKLQSPRQGSVARRISLLGAASLFVVLMTISGVMSVIATGKSRERIVTWIADKTQSVADSADAFDMTSRMLVDKFYASFKAEFGPTFTLDESEGLLKNWGSAGNGETSAVDRFAANTGGVATIFMRKGDDFQRIAEEIHRLRVRMERELSSERRGRRDFKLGRGGLADIEFAVQLLQMRHGADPRVRTTETLSALDALCAAGYLSAEHAETLRDGHAFLRKLEQRLRIVHADATQLLEEDAPGVPLLARRMGIRGRTSAERAAELLARYGAITVERLYEDPFTTLHTDGLDGVFTDERTVQELLDILNKFSPPGPQGGASA